MSTPPWVGHACDAAPAPATTGPVERRATAVDHAGGRTSGTHPALRLLGFFVLAYVTLTAACVGLGLLVTDTAVPAGVRRWDVSVNRWFVGQRTGALDGLTAVGSHLAETPTVIGVGPARGRLVWWRRRDLFAVGILVVGLTLEVSVFVTTTLFVDRSRPPVHHLDAAPADVELPERPHRGRGRPLRRADRRRAPGLATRRLPPLALSVVLALVPVAVGLSRLYRGMHQPTDVVAGALLGAVALLVAATAVRATVAHSAPPDRHHDRGDVRA